MSPGCNTDVECMCVSPVDNGKVSPCLLVVGQMLLLLLLESIRLALVSWW